MSISKRTLKLITLCIVAVAIVCLSAITSQTVFAINSTPAQAASNDGIVFSIGTGCSDSSGGSEGPTSLIDGNQSTKWSTPSNSAKLVIDVSHPVLVTSYVLKTGNDNASYHGRNPKTWTLKGSNVSGADGNTASHWTTIHTVSDSQMADVNHTDYTFTISGNQAYYSHYMLDITSSTDNNAGTFMQLSELSFNYTIKPGDATFKTYDGSPGSNSSEGVSNLCDGNLDTKWCVSASTCDAYIEVSKSVIITGYILTTGTDSNTEKGRNPKNWYIKGSNDKSNWTTIQTVTDDTTLQDVSKGQYTFTVSNSTAYKYYHLDVDANHGGNCTQLNELEFIYVTSSAVSLSAVDGTVNSGKLSENYDKIVDGKKVDNDFTKWCYTIPSGGMYAVIKASNSILVKGYAFTTGNDNAGGGAGRNPKDWILYGSNDYNESAKTGNWTAISTVSNDTSMSDINFRQYNFSASGNNDYYRYYKILITAARSGSMVQFCELEFAYEKCEHTSYNSWTAEVAATCTSNGTKAHKDCSTCGTHFDANNNEITDLTIAALGHSMTGSIAHKDATCTATGVVGGTYCTRCNDGKAEAEATIAINPNAHSYGEWVAEVPATCTSTGTKGHQDCTRCNKHFDTSNNVITDLTLSINPNAHSYGEWINSVPATCTTNGTKGHKDCTRCKKHFDINLNEISDLTLSDPNAHDYGTLVDEVPATCLNTGVKKHYTCSRCNKNFDEEHAELSDLTIAIDANNHTGTGTWVDDEEIKATKHKKIYSCCGAIIVDTEPHEWENGVCTECNYQCVHTGGTATCKEQMECTICSQKYGDLNPNNHADSEETWVKTATTHIKKWNCCGVETVSEEDHKWQNGVCTDCTYVCTHTGGTATCKEQKECTICSQKYGDLDPNNHVDSEETWVKTATTHLKKWNCCGVETVSEEDHKWQNGVCTDCTYACTHTGGTATCDQQATCDNCGTKYGGLDPDNHIGTLSDWQDDGTKHWKQYSCCPDAHVDEANHSGGEATCSAKATCTTCSKVYGDLDPNNHVDSEETWVKTATTHLKKWNCCGVITVNLAEHDWENGVCTECSYGCVHTGGTATCAQKAICTTCSNYYGEVDSNNHTGTLSSDWKHDDSKHWKEYSCCNAHDSEAAHTEGTAATCESRAVCSGCQKEYGVALGHDYGTLNAEVPAKCEETGTIAYYVCGRTGCGKKFNSEYAEVTDLTIEALGHDTENHAAQAATCTDIGWDAYETCKRTGCTYSTYKELPALGHDYGSLIPEVPAKCNSTGTKEHYKCSKCNAYFDKDYKGLDDLTIPVDSTNHAGTKTWHKDSTKHSKTCDDCNATLVAEAEHTWENGVCTICEYVCVHAGGTATCTEKATCDYCKSKYGDLKAHNYGDWNAAQDPTCVDDGNKGYYYCSDCEQYFDATYKKIDGGIVIAAHGHDYGAWIAEVPATCVSEGTKGHYHCKYCNNNFGEKSNDSIITDLVLTKNDNHDLATSWSSSAEGHYHVCLRNGCSYQTATEAHTPGTAATCESKAKCSVCKENYGSPLGHNYGTLNAEKPANCEEAGTIAYYECDRCNKKFNSDKVAVTDLTIEALGHDFSSEWTEDVAAKCTVDGSESRHCSRCKATTDSRPILAPGHTGGTATCTDQATCSVCSTKYGELAPHNYGVWIKQVDSDCVNEGTLGHYSCSGCSKSFDVDKKEITDLSIDALGHDTENHEAKDPTCTEDGWYAYETCKREGCTYSTKVVRTSPGHNYGDWIAEVPATCVDNGTKGHYKCSVCKLNFDVDKNAITDITLYAEGHKGGTATCDQQAICDNCGTKYGSFDPDNHSGKKVWAQTSTTHTQKWDCCDDVTVNATEHVWENGICSDCEYKCVHTGGTANCHELAKCEICGNRYGYFIQDAHTGFKAWFCSESTHRRVWSCCNASIVAEEEHEWENGECKECGYDCSHTWTDSVCDKCGLECVDHTGGTATCIKLAVCSTCGAEYGTTDTSKHVGKIVWTREAHTHKSSWDCCGLPVVTEESHEWLKGSCTECDYKCAHSGWTDDVCDDCGYTCPHKHWTNGVCDLCSHVCVHTGGTATCSYKATCNVCGSKYGVLDPENHSDLVFVPAAPSTASQEGNRDHYYCSGCGKYYDCTEEKEEIEHIEVVIEKLPPEIVIGNDQSRPLNSGDGLSVMSNALREDFVIVLVNGTELDSSDYTISEDNLEIVLNAEYLNTLKRGKHRLVIRSASGDAVTTFTITRARIPVWGWVAIGIASIAILSSIIVSILKRTGVIIPY